MTAFTAEQLADRRRGLGGSEIAAILGLHPFMGPLDVHLAKVEEWTTPSNADMERGEFLEAGIANWYSHREQLELHEPGGLWHPTRKIARCTPDRIARLLDAPTRIDRKWLGRLVSIKSPRRAGDSWGDTGGHTVPEYCVLQLQWEDAVLSAGDTYAIDPLFHLVALVEGDLRVYPVERDLEFQSWLLDFAEGWWAKHVTQKVSPPLDGGDTASAWLRRRFPRNTRPLQPAGLDGEVLLAELKAARKVEADAKAVAALARQKVEEHIGDADGIEGALGRVTWRARKDGIRVFKPQFNEE